MTTKTFTPDLLIETVRNRIDDEICEMLDYLSGDDFTGRCTTAPALHAGRRHRGP